MRERKKQTISLLFKNKINVKRRERIIVIFERENKFSSNLKSVTRVSGTSFFVNLFIEKCLELIVETSIFMSGFLRPQNTSSS